MWTAVLKSLQAKNVFSFKIKIFIPFCGGLEESGNTTSNPVGLEPLPG